MAGRMLVTDLDVEPRTLLRQVVAGMEERDLLTAASAIAFQVLTALLPLALLVLSVMGFLQLDEVWTRDLAPQVEEQVSPHVFGVVDDVARHTLGSKQGWWLTAGLVFTLWQTTPPRSSRAATSARCRSAATTTASRACSPTATSS